MDIEKLIRKGKSFSNKRESIEDELIQDLTDALSTLQAENEMLRAELEQVKAERDAAVADLTFAVNKYRLFTTDINLCYLCKFNFPSSGENEQTYECPGCYGDDCFEWRGPQKEDWHGTADI